MASTTSNNITPRGGGPLSRTWPQLFKKRRRASPPREVLEQHVIEANTLPPLKIPLPRAGSVSTSDNASVAPSTSTSSTQAEMLASKSNYEWIAEGRHAEMGLHFSTAMATGVMMRRATHRAAEQARRDRMKTAMIDLAEYVLDGEVTFGTGTSCFVVSREEAAAAAAAAEGQPAGGAKGSKANKGRNINKARIVEIALEKLKEQEQEIAALEERLKHCDCGEQMMDTSA